jgi:transposase
MHVQPFSKMFEKAPRYLMRYYLHPSDILSLGEEGLREISIRENLKIRDQTIKILLDFAQNPSISIFLKGSTTTKCMIEFI